MKRPFAGLFDAASGGGGGGGGGAPGVTIMGGPAPAGGPAPGAPAPGAPAPGAPDPGTSVPYFRGLYDETGKLNHANFDRLPEHLKPAAETFKKYPTMDGLLGAAWNAFGLVGKKGLMPLPQGADDNAKAEFNARLREILGVPAKPEEYGVKKPDGLPDSLWDQEYVTAVVNTLHKHNAPPGLVQDLLKVDSEFARNKSTRIENEHNVQYQAAVTALRTEFGADFDRKVALAKQVAVNAGLDPTNPAVGNNPDLIRAFAKIGALLGEDKITGGPEGGGPGKGQTYAERAQDVVFNKQNPDHAAYHNSGHPQHKAVTEKVLEWNRLGLEEKRRAGAK